MKLKATFATKIKKVSTSFSLTILGSGGALPVIGKFPSSQYLQIEQHGFLIDAGEGVQWQLLQAGTSPNRIRHILISHLHGDHYLGLMGLLFSMHLTSRKQDLHLYSHSGLEEIILVQLKHAKSVLSYTIHFHHLNPGKQEVIIDLEELTVSTIPLKHRLPCSGFLFKEKTKPYRIHKEKISEKMLLQHILRLKEGHSVVDDEGKILFDIKEYTLPPLPSRSYAYCSDTAPDPTVIEMIKGCDLLYHEATFMNSESKRAEETFHSTAAQAAQTAKEAQVKRLLIGHISARYKESNALLDEAKAIFPMTTLAIEGDTHTIEI